MKLFSWLLLISSPLTVALLQALHLIVIMKTIQAKELNCVYEERHGSCLTSEGQSMEEQQL